MKRHSPPFPCHREFRKAETGIAGGLAISPWSRASKGEIS